MKKQLLFPIPFFFAAFLLIFISCQREVDSTGFIPPPSGSGDAVTVMASMRGVVIDENNQPVAGASVTSGTNTTTTDRYGVFSFKNISLSRENGAVKVTKAGYFTGFRTFYTTAGRTHNVRIRLLPKNITSTFNAATGGSVTLSSGGKLVIPAAAIVDASGNAYNGTVNIAMTWIDPTLSNLPEVVPGDLRGLTTAGEERGLQTFGMLGVEMTGAGNAPLKIATGKTAELSFPIPASLSSSAPSTIDLWHFDETTARWKQDGTATKTGSMYIANVSHFSFWNCDAPFPLVNLCMTLVNADGQPLNNVHVRIKRSNGSYASGWTDSSGNLCGKVPKDEALVLQVMDQCYSVVYSQNIGPFSVNSTLGTITVTIPPVNTLIITGTVTNCSGGNVTNGAVVVYTNGSNSYSAPVSNGTFSISLIRCSTVTLNFSVIGIDYTTLQQSNPVSGTGTSGTVNVGTIQACGTSSSQFLEFIIDGIPYSFVPPADSLMSYDSLTTSGAYSAKTKINAFGTSGGQTGNTGTGGLYFWNNLTTGTYPLTRVYIYKGISVQSEVIITANPTVNITAFGPAGGGFIEGNFNLQMMFGATPRNVIGNFRVRRN